MSGTGRGGPLLALYKAPVNRLNGNDLRLWHLLDGGEADVLCFAYPGSEPVRGEITDPLPWRSMEIEVIAPDGWAAAVNRAVDRMRPSHLVVHVHSRLDHLAWLRGIVHPFNAHFPDCLSLMYRRRYAAMPKLRRPGAALAAGIRHRQWLAAEAEVAGRAARCILTGAADQDAFAGGVSAAVAVGNGTDWTLAPPVYQVRDNARVIAFHGNIAWRPNIAGIELVCRHVLPLVREKMPGAEFHIAGGPLTPDAYRLARLPGVVFRGYVEDLRGFLAGCDVYAAPMAEGSGVKNKLLEAMAAGMPVVINQLGAEALDAQCRSLIGIGDDAASMARLILDLLASPERRTAASAAVCSHARAHYGWPAFARQFRDTLAPI